MAVCDPMNQTHSACTCDVRREPGAGFLCGQPSGDALRSTENLETNRFINMHRFGYLHMHANTHTYTAFFSMHIDLSLSNEQ